MRRGGGVMLERGCRLELCLNCCTALWEINRRRRRRRRSRSRRRDGYGRGKSRLERHGSLDSGILFMQARKFALRSGDAFRVQTSSDRVSFHFVLP